MNAPSSFQGNEQQEKEDGNVFTMVDFLEEENELEKDVNAVLGGADDRICSYSKGYLFRQPLYACATCNPPEKEKAAGICLACSYRCHEGHELIELYTKRNFRCDCGNSLFPNNKCNLEPVKDETNANNTYNQNFLGVYCTCKRPYPDPEETDEDEMIQCVVCEDWYHRRHLGTDSTFATDFGEMICQECMSNHPFFWKYSGLCIKPKEPTADESLNISVTDTATSNCEESQDNKNKEQNPEDVKEVKGECYLKMSNLEVGTGSTFWPDGWRKNLCTCQECLALYEKEKVSFLLNETDTVQYYENKNKETATSSQYEESLKILNSMDRIQQVEVIEGYNQMKRELMDFLQKFAQNKKVVREEDIREFFTEMQARKKHKAEIPYFCR